MAEGDLLIYTRVMKGIFHKFAVLVSNLAGSPIVFVGAIIVISVWAFSGPTFGFSDTWQLIINTSTTIVTFLMVFLIQNTQNRDNRAFHLKLDELLRGVKGARTQLVDLEDLSDEELEKLHGEFKNLHESYSKELVKRGKKLAYPIHSSHSHR